MLKTKILKAAVEITRRRGLSLLTRAEVALNAGAASGTVNYHFKSMVKLREAIIDYAIENRDLKILGRELYGRYARLLNNLTPELRRRAQNHLIKGN